MEGPSLIILYEELQRFLGQKIKKVWGNTTQPKELLHNTRFKKIETWGKNLFLEFVKGKHTFWIKIHFMFFGSYCLDDSKEDRVPRLALNFDTGTVYFYSCSLKFVGPEEFSHFDKEVDVLGEEWNADHVLDLLEDHRSDYLCDLFLDQNLFAGSGNIVKNEVLFNLRRHPLTRLRDVPKKDWNELIFAIRMYCFDFYQWKKSFELRSHWQVYRKFACKICGSKLVRERLGKWERICFYCPICQSLEHKRDPLTLHDVLPIENNQNREERLDH